MQNTTAELEVMDAGEPQKVAPLAKDKPSIVRIRKNSFVARVPRSSVDHTLYSCLGSCDQSHVHMYNKFI